MRIRGNRENYSYLNLGGGVGAKEDSLFYFKSGFSKNTASFKVWKYIVNQLVYDELVQRGKDVGKHEKFVQFFPHYRITKY